MPFTLIYSLLIFIALFSLLELRSLIKKQQWRELIVAIFFFSIALSYGTDYAMGWNMMPNPHKILFLVKPISEAFESFFQVAG